MTQKVSQTMTGEQIERRKRRIAGLALVAIGVLALAVQLFDLAVLGLLLLPILGLIFVAWGATTREAGLMIPGGILLGIGAGVALMNASFVPAGETATAGIFLLAFAGGWALVTLTSALFTDETVWWALIPGGILATIGGALIVGGTALAVLEVVGRFWPVALVIAGIYLLFWRQRSQ